MASASNRIKKLDPVVVNRIAAGEVVQRPSSAIKELIENSIDAGASAISVTVKNGGLDLIQICDNGHGIEKDDLIIVCERFTTSKLTTFNDLQTIQTFGFRGEALASITHVAKVNILTKTAASPCAYRAHYCDGKLIPDSSKPQACIKPTAGVLGTTITVEDLFYNMPTRKSAFKQTSDEYQRVLDVITKYSVHYGGCKQSKSISFTLKKHGKVIPDLHTPLHTTTAASNAVDGVLENIRIAYGHHVARELLDISYASSPSTSTTDHQKQHQQQAFSLTFTGKISNANFSNKANSSSSSYSSSASSSFLLFINHRLVDSSAIRKMIDSLYSDILPRHCHPFVYLSLILPSDSVDVNVHPTKREVMLLHEEQVISMIQEQMKRCLQMANESRMFLVKDIVVVKPNNSSNSNSNSHSSNSHTVGGEASRSSSSSKQQVSADALAATSPMVSGNQDVEGQGQQSERHPAEQVLATTAASSRSSAGPSTVAAVRPAFNFAAFRSDTFTSSSTAASSKSTAPTANNSSSTSKRKATTLAGSDNNTLSTTTSVVNAPPTQLAPNKMIRIDPTLQKIPSFFKHMPSSSTLPALSSQPTSIRPTVVASSAATSTAEDQLFVEGGGTNECYCIEINPLQAMSTATGNNNTIIGSSSSNSNNQAWMMQQCSCCVSRNYTGGGKKRKKQASSSSSSSMDAGQAKRVRIAQDEATMIPIDILNAEDDEQQDVDNDYDNDVDEEQEGEDNDEEDDILYIADVPTTASKRVTRATNMSSSSATVATATANKSAAAIFTMMIPTLPDLKLTSSPIASIQQLLQEIYVAQHDLHFTEMIKGHVYVGNVDLTYSLIQYQTKLYLVNHDRLLQELFYQLIIQQFGEMGRGCQGNGDDDNGAVLAGKLVLDPPVKVKDYLRIAIEEELELEGAEEEQPEGVDEANKSNSSVEEMLQACLVILRDKKELLEEYFAISFTTTTQAKADSDGGNGDSELMLTAMPMILANYHPLCPDYLPAFLYHLCSEINWQEEQHCFQEIARLLADFYAALPIADHATDKARPSSKLKQSIVFPSKEAIHQLEHVLFPALKKYLIGCKGILHTTAMVEIAALEKLYRIFERC